MILKKKKKRALNPLTEKLLQQIRVDLTEFGRTVYKY